VIWGLGSLTSFAVPLTLNLDQLGDHASTQHIFYLLNFGKIETTIEFEQARKIISEVQSINCLELPKKPDDVPVDIIDILSFKLPLEDNSKMAAAVKSLRLIYTFE
ncbi:12889_t:CDS:1, partial [Racocetra fulgida]